MDPFQLKLFESIVSTGPVAALLVLAVWWQTRGNQALVQQLNTERIERMEAMEDEIDRQRTRSDDCEKDRLELHRKISDIELDRAKKESLPSPCRK